MLPFEGAFVLTVSQFWSLGELGLLKMVSEITKRKQGLYPLLTFSDSCAAAASLFLRWLCTQDFLPLLPPFSDHLPLHSRDLPPFMLSLFSFLPLSFSSSGSHTTPPPVFPLGDPLPIHHYFHGYLAGFTVRPGSLESREVMECLYACREGLDYSDFDSLGKGMKVTPSLLTA